MNKGMLLRLRNAFHSRWVKTLWKSQCRMFGKMGSGSQVASLPAVLGAEHIEIGDRFYCGSDVRMEAWSRYGERSYSPRIVIGNNVILTDRCHLSCIDRIEIGDDVLLGRDVFVSDNGHGDTSSGMLKMPPRSRPLSSKGPVVIGKNVWVGRQVTILSGVTIGEGAVIGANSVVNKDIPAFCVAAGNPVKIVKTADKK